MLKKQIAIKYDFQKSYSTPGKKNKDYAFKILIQQRGSVGKVFVTQTWAAEFGPPAPM